jgi:hypothetical protein
MFRGALQHFEVQYYISTRAAVNFAGYVGETISQAEPTLTLVTMVMKRRTKFEVEQNFDLVFMSVRQPTSFVCVNRKIIVMCTYGYAHAGSAGRSRTHYSMALCDVS